MSTRFLQLFDRLAQIGYTRRDAGVGIVGNAAFLNIGGTLIPVGDVTAGTTYYVDTSTGLDTNNGKSWSNAFLTMGKAFTSVASGDTIRFRGKVKEQLTAPVQVFDVTIIGSGTRPRHADSTPAGGQLAANTWAAPDAPVAATPLCKLQQQGWSFVNILFAAPTDASDLACAVHLFRDAGAGDLERDSSHASFYGCRFASGAGGINDTGGCANVGIYGCRFEALTRFCILGVGNIGVGQSNWDIRGNTFDEMDNGIKIAGFGCRIENNTFTAGLTPNTTFVLNVSNGGGSKNFIVGNFFQTATANFNTPDVVGNATDVWVNMSIDAAAAGTSGVYEVGNPA